MKCRRTIKIKYINIQLNNVHSNEKRSLKYEVAVIMGSKSDYTTMEETCKLLEEFEIPFDKKVVSAHRTPDLLVEFSKNAKANDYSLIIAAAGGAAHLPGMVGFYDDITSHWCSD